MLRIDPVTADRVRQTVQAARAAGGDPVAAMDKAGLLRYDARRHADQLELIDSMIDSIVATPADKVVSTPIRAPMTQLDLKMSYVQFLRGFREGFARYGKENLKA